MTTVVTYRNNERECYCQLKFESGERVLVSIAAAPTPSVMVRKLAFGGLVPRQTVWEYNPTMAGGYNAYVQDLIKMFPPDTDESEHPLDAISSALFPCASIDEARRTLLRCEVRASDLPQRRERPEPFDEALFACANHIRTEGGLRECEGVTDAAVCVLSHISTSVLAGGGPGHLPHPSVSSTLR